jgi:hypothetical protein
MSRDWLAPWILLVLCGGAIPAQEPAMEPVSSTAYRGHEHDADMDAFVRAFPAARGTRLDDCQTCHRPGEVQRGGDRTIPLNPCSYCHLIPFPDDRLSAGAPGSFADTLNPFGLAYREGGRTAAALRALAEQDSDGDTFPDGAEIAAGRYPGDPDSHPGQAWAPTVTLTTADLAALPQHTQLVLMNSHRQHRDCYALYEGVTLETLLAGTGVDLAGATGVTAIAPDGFMVDVTLDDLRQPFPAGTFARTPATEGFVDYPPDELLPAGLADGKPIPGTPRLLLACHRDGAPLDPATLDPRTGKLRGEGPYRLVEPQRRPGPPDRGSSVSPSGNDDGWDHDETKDHNAGRGARGVVALRVNPLPAGVEEYDWKHGGWGLIAGRALIVYGHGVPED